MVFILTLVLVLSLRYFTGMYGIFTRSVTCGFVKNFYSLTFNITERIYCTVHLLGIYFLQCNMIYFFSYDDAILDVSLYQHSSSDELKLDISTDEERCLKMTALYAWGANSHGQLGLGFVSEQVCENAYMLSELLLSVVFP